jgi:GT2 family glycosyltransferase
VVNIGIIILNYIAYEETIKCVEYFEQQNQNGYSSFIVIVDNKSPNNSFENLRKNFIHDSQVSVVTTDVNAGFAKGNNFGYDELLKHMQPDFVITSNSDAFAKKQNLFPWILEKYQKYDFSVLGPAIYSVRGKFYQSPLENLTTNLSELCKIRRGLRLSIFKTYIKKILHYQNSFALAKWDNPYYKEVHSDKTLHGALQIFSKKYFSYYQEPYDPRTFLYREEDILRVRCNLKNLKMVYDPSYTVEHLQAVSTEKAQISSNAQLMRLKNLLHSLNVYINLIESSEN